MTFTRAIETLVVEDELAVQKLVDVLLRAGRPGEFLVQRAGSLAAAERAVQGLAPDLIVLDLELPDARGLEALKALLRLAPVAAIVVLTATDDEALALEAIRLGAEDWLHKDADLARALPRAVQFAVARKRTRRRED
jgi:DNA-binding NarL/FixJ family response regulator